VQILTQNAAKTALFRPAEGSPQVI